MNKFPLELKEVDIDSVFPNSYNPNEEKQEVFAKLIANMKLYGQIDPVLVRPIPGDCYEIVDGEHRWRGCKELGYTKVQVGIIRGISDSDAKLLTLTMNNYRGTDNVLKRAQMLKQMSEGQLALLPYTKEEITAEMKLLDFDFSQFDKANADDVKSTDLGQEAAKLSQALYNKLWRLHEQSKDVQFRLLLEGFYDWHKQFIAKIS